MTARIGWGILGCGWVATESIAPAIRWSVNGRLVAVASRDGSVAEAKARETGAERAYAPYEAMLADPAVNAVYIGLPNGLHEEWVLRCAEAGKHVLCEKSLTMSAASAARMSAACASRGLCLVEAFMYRHHPQWSVVLGWLREGAIGRVYMVRSTFCSRFDKSGDARWSSLGGGALWDLTCYSVDAVRYVTGFEPVRALAIADSGTPERVDASSQASLELEGGVLAFVAGSLRAGLDQSLVVVGERGTVEVVRPFVTAWEPTHVVLRREGREGRVDEERRVEVGGANHYLHQVEHFARRVLDPDAPAWPSEDGVRNVAACEAISKSMGSGRAEVIRY